MAVADALARASLCTRTSEKSAPSRASMSVRTPSSRGRPPVRRTSWTADLCTSAPPARRSICTTAALPTAAWSPSSPAGRAAEAGSSLREEVRSLPIPVALASS